jgi:hypothetical protein
VTRVAGSSVAARAVHQVPAMIIERGGAPLLKLAVGSAAIAAAALLVRRLLKKPEVKMTVVRGDLPAARRAANENVEVPWGVEV